MWSFCAAATTSQVCENSQEEDEKAQIKGGEKRED